MLPKRTHILCVVMLLLAGRQFVFSQSFLNGNFEINSASPCDFNLVNATFTSKMANAMAYGGGNELDIMQGGCGYGSPQSGTWFVGVASPGGVTDAFTMTLSAPLVSGNTYTMQFYDKGDVTYNPAMPVIIGVSTVAGASGTTVYTGPTPTIGTWSLRTFSFVAPNNGQYISVRTAGPTRWTHVDNFSIVSTLPVELTKFSCESLNDGIRLSWSTATETENNYFAIERAAGDTAFSEIARVNGNGTRSQPSYYAFVDEQPLPGENYYRLKQVDYNGQAHYFKITSCSYEPSGESAITVYSAMGALIFSGTTTDYRATMQAMQLAPGLYVVALTKGSKTVFIKYLAPG